MSSYFDDLMSNVSEIPALDEEDFLLALIGIEAQLIHEVNLVTGDREFPPDLRENIQGIIAISAVQCNEKLPRHPLAVEYALATRSSQLVDALHMAFHELARRRIETRFGMLSDNPGHILAMRDDHDLPKLFDMKEEEELVIIAAGLNEPIMIQRLAYVVGPEVSREYSDIRQHGRKVAERCHSDSQGNWVLTTTTREERLALESARFIHS